MFQANQCYFRDLQNPGGLLFMLIKGFQVTWTRGMPNGHGTKSWVLGTKSWVVGSKSWVMV